MGDTLPRTPMNHRAKLDAASFILGGEIRNRTNTRNYKNIKQIYPHLAHQHVWVINGIHHRCNVVIRRGLNALKWGVTFGWRCAVVTSLVVAYINEVTLRRARLVLRWVTVSLPGYTVSVCNQPARPTYPPTLIGWSGWEMSTGWRAVKALRPEVKDRYGSCLLFVSVYLSFVRIYTS